MSIDVGDTVMPIDACCDRTRGFVGWIGRVEQMAVVLSPRPCDFCELAPTDSWQAGITIEQFGHVPVRRLKKIEPPKHAAPADEPVESSRNMNRL